MYNQVQSPRESLPGSLSDRFLSSFPSFPTPLVGRTDEQAMLRSLLLDSDIRLLTLAGTGGVGKTRVAVAVAKTLWKEGISETAFVSLASVREPALVLPTIAQALGILMPMGNTLDVVLRIFLARTPLMLVLDNFEQVRAATPLLLDLLSSCPSLKILITSRASLGVQGEYQFSLAPLSLPIQDDLPSDEALQQSEAVMFFVQRMQQVDASFQLTSFNVRQVVQICRELDGLPLAIELVVKRGKPLSLPALLAQLEQGQQLAVTGSDERDKPTRQRTLHDTLTWSYELLLPVQQHLFRCLSVFSDSFTLEAAEVLGAQVLGTHASLLVDSVVELMNINLLQRIEHDDASTSLSMLRTVQEYGWELLRASGELEVCQQAHALYCLRLIEAAEPILHTPFQTKQLVQLNQQYTHLRDALKWLHQQHRHVELARFVTLMTYYWFLLGSGREGWTWIERIQAMVSMDELEASLRADFLFGAGFMALLNGKMAIAVAYQRECLALYRETGNQEGFVMTCWMLARFLRVDGGIAEAQSLIQEALQVARQVGDPSLLAYVLYRDGLLAAHLGQFQVAQERIEESVRLLEINGDPTFRVEVLRVLAELLLDTDELYAQSLLSQGLALSRTLLVPWTTAGLLNDLGSIMLQQGDRKQARLLLEEGQHIHERLGYPPGIVRSYCLMSRIARADADQEEAWRMAKLAMEVAQASKDMQNLALALEHLALVFAEKGEIVRAVQLCGSAEYMHRSMQEIPRKTYVLDERERMLVQAQEQLGTSTFETLWQEGRQLGITLRTSEQYNHLWEQHEQPRTSPAKKETSLEPRLEQLTTREQEVLRLLVQGLTNKQIAKHLQISISTANAHVASIYLKLGVSTRSAAAYYTFSHDLFQGLAAGR